MTTMTITDIAPTTFAGASKAAERIGNPVCMTDDSGAEWVCYSSGLVEPTNRGAHLAVMNEMLTAHRIDWIRVQAHGRSAGVEIADVARSAREHGDGALARRAEAFLRRERVRLAAIRAAR